MSEDTQRYLAAAHAMQSGVAMKMGYDAAETSPKHLRTGVNSAMVETATLFELLLEKGVITREEFEKKLADNMEREVGLYRKTIAQILDVPIERIHLA